MNARGWIGALSLVAIACGGSDAPRAVSPAGTSSASATPSATPSASPSASPSAAPSAAPTWSARSIPLPGAAAPASLDYLAFERGHARVWVPVGTTGSVDLLDTQTLAFTRVDGFATAEREVRGAKRVVGPSSASVGDGFVYVGDRATSEVCPVDVATLRIGTCVKLASSPDGVAYVASAKEVWVTTPSDRTLTLLDASRGGVLARKGTVTLEGAPEGYAVDEAHGLFFTNLEDRGGTVVVDVATRAVKATWSAGCGAAGPRGLVFDARHGFLIVACTDHLQVLDAGHGGARLGRVDTGEGVDNLDFYAENGWIYAAASKAARLTVAKIDDGGELSIVGTAATSVGARNAAVDGHGDAYVADGPGARLWVLRAPGR